jgi:hypothetical protein
LKGLGKLAITSAITAGIVQGIKAIPGDQRAKDFAVGFIDPFGSIITLLSTFPYQGGVVSDNSAYRKAAEQRERQKFHRSQPAPGIVGRHVYDGEKPTTKERIRPQGQKGAKKSPFHPWPSGPSKILYGTVN